MRASVISGDDGGGRVPVLAVGGPAATAEAPNQQVPCLAHVFQAQAVSAPQTVSDRILEIREPRSGSVGVR